MAKDRIFQNQLSGALKAEHTQVRADQWDYCEKCLDPKPTDELDFNMICGGCKKGPPVSKEEFAEMVKIGKKIMKEIKREKRESKNVRFNPTK